MVSAPAEFARFARDNYDDVVATLTLYAGDPDVAEELAHDALVRARRHWGSVRDDAARGAWLHRVAINLANSYFRRKIAERRAMSRVRHRRDRPTPSEPEDALLIRDAVGQLTPRQREAVVLRYFVDLSVKEAAGMMGITEGSMKQLTHRALVSLRSDRNIRHLLEQEATVDGI